MSNAHMGDGRCRKEVEVHWPSGIMLRLENMRGDRILTIDEQNWAAAGGMAGRNKGAR